MSRASPAVRRAGWISSSYSAIDFLIVNVDWTPASSEVVFQVQDREQTWLDLNVGERRLGAAAPDPA